MRTRLVSIAALLAVAGFLLPLAGAIGTRVGLWRFVAGFGLLAAGVLAALAAVVLGLIGGWTSGRWGLAAAAMAGGLIAAVIPLSAMIAGFAAPPIHDISTDTTDPPRFAAVLPLRGADASPAEYDGPETAAQQQRAYPDIKPIMVSTPPPATLERVIAVARDLGWTIMGQDPSRGTLEATDTTFWFGFTDDIVVR
ncbi:MAG TPA: DUF1499 domain-containing protein, partial [Vicinamibacterales bacterium]|nr:DUF1499 domain-containing protein [Vicinamibacterales bacterium]